MARGRKRAAVGWGLLGLAAVAAGLAVASERYSMRAPLLGGFSLTCVEGVFGIHHDTPGDGPPWKSRFAFDDRWGDGLPGGPEPDLPNFAQSRAGVRVEPGRWWRDRSGLISPVWWTPVVWYERFQVIGQPTNGAIFRSLNLLLRPLALAAFLAGAPLVWAARRSARRARLGHCPACGYDRAGLGPGKACPECGRAADGPRGGEDSPQRR